MLTVHVNAIRTVSWTKSHCTIQLTNFQLCYTYSSYGQVGVFKLRALLGSFTEDALIALPLSTNYPTPATSAAILNRKQTETEANDKEPRSVFIP